MRPNKFRPNESHMHCAAMTNKMGNRRTSNRCKSMRTFTVTKENVDSVVADMADSIRDCETSIRTNGAENTQNRDKTSRREN